MILAIGTKSPPKVKAITEASINCVYFEGKKIEILSKKVESEVSDMPLSLEENIEGAKNRAKNTKKLLDFQGKTADFYIGMEGGTTLIGDKAFLFGVTCILDSKGESHLGFSSMMQVPEKIKNGLYNNGKELGPLMSELSGSENIQHNNGSFGLWTEDQIVRQDEFENAFICAIAPFYNKYYKL